MLSYVHGPQFSTGYGIPSQAVEFAIYCGIFIFLWNSTEFDERTGIFWLSFANRLLNVTVIVTA